MAFAQQLLQGAAPGIIARMASGRGDAAFKSQASGGIIEQRLARSLGLEAVSFRSSIVQVSGHAGDGAGFAPEIALFPIRRGAGWFEEYDENAKIARNLSKEPFQFPEAGAGAGTPWMSEHQ